MGEVIREASRISSADAGGSLPLWADASFYLGVGSAASPKKASIVGARLLSFDDMDADGMLDSWEASPQGGGFTLDYSTLQNGMTSMTKLIGFEAGGNGDIGASNQDIATNLGEFASDTHARSGVLGEMVPVTLSQMITGPSGTFTASSTISGERDPGGFSLVSGTAWSSHAYSSGIRLNADESLWFKVASKDKTLAIGLNRDDEDTGWLNMDYCVLFHNITSSGARRANKSLCSSRWAVE